MIRNTKPRILECIFSWLPVEPVLCVVTILFILRRRLIVSSWNAALKCRESEPILMLNVTLPNSTHIIFLVPVLLNRISFFRHEATFMEIRIQYLSLDKSVKDFQLEMMAHI
ncbi:hypothetical protein M9H77_24816 [Catharanthus roseus]|uniref:Uncharacterized protein n=1 Tax=Catharanthus roseus TaxID=4058 RepID=A0ACC0A552_CATRO|nr:hypothetical protein M9H77_24816 [Catharanthus roseus]